MGRVYDVKGTNYGSGGTEGLPATHEIYRWDALGNRLEYQQPEDAYPTQVEYLQNTNRQSVSHPPDGVGNSGQPYKGSAYDRAGNQEWFSADNFMTNVVNKQETFQFRLTRSYFGADGKLRASDGNHCYLEYAPGLVGAVCLGAAQLKNETSGGFEWYRYDALGRRVLVRARRDHNCTNTAECSSTITRFVWDGDQILYEIQAPGGDVSAGELENDNAYGNQYGRVLYTNGPAIDHPLDIIRMQHTPPSGYGFDACGGPYPVLPFGNWRGTFIGGTTARGVKLRCSPTCLVSWPGSRYRAFLERDRAVHQQNWFGSLTAGQESSNGLMYMRNRYYNPLTGAFTQPDPIGLAGGLNTYGFADGDPVTYRDPYGLSAQQACEPFCTGLDAALLAADLNNIRKNGLGWGNGIGAGLGIISVGLPFVTGSGATDDAARGGVRLLTGARWAPTNFRPGELDRHFANHAAERGAGNLTKGGYLTRARQLLRSDVGGHIQGFTRRGDIVRYNARTNEFAVAASDGTIRTLFRPTDGADYYAREAARP